MNDHYNVSKVAAQARQILIESAELVKYVQFDTENGNLHYNLEPDELPTAPPRDVNFLSPSVEGLQRYIQF